MISTMSEFLIGLIKFKVYKSRKDRTFASLYIHNTEICVATDTQCPCTLLRLDQPCQGKYKTASFHIMQLQREGYSASLSLKNPPN